MTLNHTLLIAAIMSLGMMTQTAAAQDKVIAVLNGEKLTESQLMIFAKGQTGQAETLLDDPDKRTQIINAFVDREILYQKAVSQKLDQDPEIKSQLDELRHRLLSQALIQRVVSANPVSEADIKKHYDQQIKKLTGDEYLIQHILVKNESDAAAAIKRLDKGEEFAALAKTLSQDVSARQGGEIGWLPAQAMPTGMAAAVKNTSVNTYHKSPVETEHGWHVVRVADTRPIQPPPLDRVRPQIENALRNEFMKNYLQQARQETKVELK